MIMKAGQQWRCSNPACRCEVLVQSSAGLEGSNPRCVCGALMKKEYTPPNLSYLDSLRVDDLAVAPDRSSEA